MLGNLQVEVATWLKQSASAHCKMIAMLQIQGNRKSGLTVNIEYRLPVFYAFSNATDFKLILAANRKRARFLAPTNHRLIDIK